MTLTKSLSMGLLLTLAAIRAGAEMVCVSTAKANIRDGAGKDYPAAWLAERNTPFEILGWNGDWANVVDFEEDSGWAHRSVIIEGDCVIVKGKRANIRSGAGLEFDSVWELERGYPLRAVRRRGDWLQVTDGDEVDGWIFYRLVWGSTKPEEFEAS